MKKNSENQETTRNRRKIGREKFEITEKTLERAEILAARGLTKQAIAEGLGISRTSFFEKIKENSEFSDAIKRGEAQAIGEVESSLFNQAVSGENITATIFFLKNRCPSGWKDKQEVEATVTTDFAAKLEAAYRRDRELDNKRRDSASGIHNN